MDFTSLKIFLRLADSLHFGKTGKACNVSPSTLSRIISRLEDELGERLFERDNRSVQLTGRGERFKHFARETLERWNSFQDALSAEQTVLQGEISMCCTITASYGVLPDILGCFREAYPGVHIKLLPGDSQSGIQQVLDGDADFAVAAMPDRLPQRLLFKPITDILLQFVAPAILWPGAALLNRAPIPWERIPLIVTEKGMARKRIDRWFKSRRIRPDIYAQVSGNESILAMVGLGFGVGIVPRLVLENNLLNREVRVLSITPPLEPYRVGICTLKRKITIPHIRAFWDTIPEKGGFKNTGS